MLKLSNKAISQRTGTPEVMGISRQEVKTANSGQPDNQIRKTVFICLRRAPGSKLHGRGNTLLLLKPKTRGTIKEKE